MRTSKFISMTAFVTAVVLLSAGFAVASPSQGGNNAWSVKVTGGGDASAGAVDFSLTMSASDVGGQFQYTRDDLVMHGTIDCVYVPEGEAYAVMSGTVSHASVPRAPFVDGADVSIAVREGGEGSGDQVRIWSESACGPYSEDYPGTYYDGNINIRSK